MMALSGDTVRPSPLSCLIRIVQFPADRRLGSVAWPLSISRFRNRFPGRRCSGGQAETSKHLGNRRRVFNRGDEFQGAATVGAKFHVDIEYPFTKTLPGFRPSGRHSPFKTASGSFVSS